MTTLGPVRRFTATARAKVNLSLEVLRKRADGYHEIETILQSISLSDELEIEFNTSGKISICCDDAALPTDGRNICYRAVEQVRPLVHPRLGAAIQIRKRIPHSAGLGGGSSDAGAVLLAAAAAVPGGISTSDLESVAARLGSDVPFMLHGGTMLGRGRGEQLTPLEALRKGVFLVVKPPLDIATGGVYRDVNLTLTKHRYRINLKAVNALLTRFPDVPLTFRNALEDAVCPAYPLVSEALGELLATRPYFAAMSGSGSALFAIYESEARASFCAERFSVRGFFTTVATPCLRAVVLQPF